MEPSGSRNIASSPVPVPAPPGGARPSFPWLPVVAVVVLTAIGSVAGTLGWVNSRAGVEAVGVASLPPDVAQAAQARVFAQTAVGQELWFAGFHVEITEALIASDLLSLTAQFTNLGPATRAWSAPLAVADGAGQSFPASRDSHYPDVPSGLSAGGTLVFAVQNGLDLASAYLVAGSTDHSQARVPLGPDGGEPLTREPSRLEVTGEMSLELADVAITAVEVRADLPEDYRQTAAGTLAVTVHFDLTSRGTRGCGGALLDRRDFALILPDGNAVAPDGGSFSSTMVTGTPTGVDFPGFAVRFLAGDPATGQYALRFRSNGSCTGLAGTGPLETTLTFAIA